MTELQKEKVEGLRYRGKTTPEENGGDSGVLEDDVNKPKQPILSEKENDTKEKAKETHPLSWFGEYAGRVATMDERSLAAMRIMFGLTILYDLMHAIFPYVELQYTDEHFSFATRKEMLDNNWSKDFPSLMMAIASKEVAYLFFFVTFIAAVCLTIGFHTQKSMLAIYVLTVSYINRNRMNLTGGDDWSKCTMFFCLFLPLDRVWAVTPSPYVNAENKNHRSVCTVATFCLWLLIVEMYVCNWECKTHGHAWTKDYSAAQKAFGLSLHTQDVGKFLMSFPAVCRFFTWATMFTEGPVPVAAMMCPFLPFVRGFGILCLIGMHLIFAATLAIGSFPWICIAVLSSALPGQFWDLLHWMFISKPTTEVDKKVYQKLVLPIEQATLVIIGAVAGSYWMMSGVHRGQSERVNNAITMIPWSSLLLYSFVTTSTLVIVTYDMSAYKTRKELGTLLLNAKEISKKGLLIVALFVASFTKIPDLNSLVYNTGLIVPCEMYCSAPNYGPDPIGSYIIMPGYTEDDNTIVDWYPWNSRWSSWVVPYNNAPRPLSVSLPYSPTNQYPSNRMGKFVTTFDNGKFGQYVCYLNRDKNLSYYKIIKMDYTDDVGLGPTIPTVRDVWSGSCLHHVPPCKDPFCPWSNITSLFYQMYDQTYSLSERSLKMIDQVVYGAKVRYTYNAIQNNVATGAVGVVHGYWNINRQRQSVKVFFSGPNTIYDGYIWVRWEKIEFVSSPEELATLRQKEKAELAQLENNKTRVQLLSQKSYDGVIFPVGSLGTVVHTDGKFTGEPVQVRWSIGDGVNLLVHPFDFTVVS
eukprot:m.343823 g.343823  ORF g.343823 m.343823 type:complete len:805 (+) comp23412_c0_seq1:162-2576(+)